MRNPVDQEKMQADLDSLQKWSVTCLLRFNASARECTWEVLGTDYNLGGEVIPHDTKEKDLGVIITEDEKSSRQCAAAASKAMTIIKRTFKHFYVKCFTMLYRTYIRPHLEYSVQAWSPHLKKDIAVLEKVQRRATKLIPSIRHMSYPERLQATKLYSLEQRRVRGDMIETFKILNGLEGIEKSKLFKPIHNKLREVEDTVTSCTSQRYARGLTAEIASSQSECFRSGTISQQEWWNQRQQTSLKGNLTISGKNLDMVL